MSPPWQVNFDVDVVRGLAGDRAVVGAVATGGAGADVW